MATRSPELPSANDEIPEAIVADDFEKFADPEKEKQKHADFLERAANEEIRKQEAMAEATRLSEKLKKQMDEEGIKDKITRKIDEGVDYASEAIEKTGGAAWQVTKSGAETLGKKMVNRDTKNSTEADLRDDIDKLVDEGSEALEKAGKATWEGVASGAKVSAAAFAEAWNEDKDQFSREKNFVAKGKGFWQKARRALGFISDQERIEEYKSLQSKK